MTFGFDFGMQYNGPLNGGGGGVTTLTYIPIYGQSLGYGTDPNDSLPVSTSAPPHLMFNEGVRAHGNYLPGGNINAALKPQNVASLVTLVEEYSGIGDPTETLATGISTKIDGTGIFATSARGSSDVAYLSKGGSGGIHYQHTVWFGARARDLALAAGYTTFNVPVIVWKQGEQDGFLGTTRANYKTLLSKLIAELRRDFTYNTLNDCSGMVMIGDQQSINNAAYAEIAVAVLEMHRNDPTEFTLVGPGYQYMNYSGANDVHLTATGYRNVGEYFGRAVRTIQDGGTWHPCHITGVSRTGTSIAVTVHVPSPPLVVDTTYLAKGAFTDYGFTYDGATITNVAITDDGTGDNVGVITITIDADAGGNLKYAYNNGSIANYIGGATTGSSGGNIRDSESAVTDYDSTPLYNWLCIDDWSVA